jgi:hypothetical protein
MYFQRSGGFKVTTTEQERKLQQNPSLMVAFLAVVYVGVAVYFLLGWAGLQSLPLVWREIKGTLPLYGLVGILGAASCILILRRKRWGVYGLLGTWAATATLNIAFPRPVNIVAMVMALLLVGITALDIRRVWRFLI